MRATVVFLFLVLSQSHGAKPPVLQGTANIERSASINELLSGYNDLQVQHPERFVDGKPLKLSMPTIDLYSPTGLPVYYGGSSKQNAVFVASLSGKSPVGSAIPPGVFRPSLAEALNLFKELAPWRTAPIASDTYTLFAVTYLDNPMCEEQNNALARLMKQPHPGLRIIQVSLH